MNILEHEMIQRSLRSGEYSRALDMSLFAKYRLGRITLNECKEQFFKNNQVIEARRMFITDEVFRVWLESLGWAKI